LLQVIDEGENRSTVTPSLASQIHELVSRINNRFGNIGWTPVQFFNRKLDPEELLASIEAPPSSP
jgi:trehalose-6-phosphate synthase